MLSVRGHPAKANLGRSGTQRKAHPDILTYLQGGGCPEGMYPVWKVTTPWTGTLSSTAGNMPHMPEEGTLPVPVPDKECSHSAGE